MTVIFPSLARPVPKWASLSRACAGALALGFASNACAEVIEIGADGTIAHLYQPMVVTVAGASPIETTAAQSTRSIALAPAFAAAGQNTELSPELIEAVAWAESRFNQSARSPAGAIGVMQLMPGTAAALGVDAADTSQNLHGGAAYLRQMLDEFDGDVVLALAAYNAGPAAVRRYGGVPPYPETQTYVASVLAYLADTSGEETEQ